MLNLFGWSDPRSQPLNKKRLSCSLKVERVNQIQIRCPKPLFFLIRKLMKMNENFNSQFQKLSRTIHDCV